MLRYMRVPAAVVALALLVLAAMHAAAVAPGNPAFQARWERTDDPVLNGQVSRTWIWGPEANTNVITEPYAESPGGQRQVQYFDKSRMEINNPDGDPDNLFYVTNGLLVIELMTGRLQLGDNTFENHNPAIVNVAGDADDPTGPTYLTMSLLRHLPALPDNSIITQRVDRAGTVTNDPSLAAQQVTAAYRVIVPGIDHQIASPFWTFMTSSGLVKVNGQYVNEALFTNPFYATGYPVTEAYWANVKVAGVYRDVLMQCFERRCLTYTPGNPAGFATEAGNVGQHYRTWRYIQIPAEVTPTATSTATGTVAASPTSDGSATATSSATPTETAVATSTSTAVVPVDYAFTGAFGEPADPANDMVQPSGVALDAEDNLYVSDASAARVQKFTDDGVWLAEWGNVPGEPGQLESPSGIEIGPDGRVYVVDTAASVVQVYTDVGEHLATLDYGEGSGEAELSGPTDIAFDQDGNMYVVDSGNNRIQVYNSIGVFQRTWGVEGSGDGEFSTPLSIAIDGEGSVYVTDYGNNRVQVFDTAGVFLRAWGGDGAEDGNFLGPTGIAIAPGGDAVYVGDDGSGRIQVFLPDGSFLRSRGEPGGGPGQFFYPAAVVLSDERVFVADTIQSRIQMFASGDDLTYLGKIDGDSRGRFTSAGIDGLAFDPTNGTIVVVDYQAALIKSFTSGGVVTEWGDIAAPPHVALANPNDVAIDGAGNYYIADGNNHRIVVFSPAGEELDMFGSSGAGDGEFNFPTGIAVDEEGSIYVVDAGNNRVQKFTFVGDYINAWGMEGASNGMFDAPIGICVQGTWVYVTDSGNNRVQVFDRDGNYQFEFGEPGTGDGQFTSPWRVTTDAAGFVYVTDDTRIQKFTPDGEFLAQIGSAGSGDGQYLAPAGIAVTPDGDVLVVDSGNGRVLMFSPVQ